MYIAIDVRSWHAAHNAMPSWGLSSHGPKLPKPPANALSSQEQLSGVHILDMGVSESGDSILFGV